MNPEFKKALVELKKQFDELNKILSQRYPKKRRGKNGASNGKRKN